MTRWIPLESNPEVLNAWANRAGLVASQAQFEDVYGLDPELLAMVSRPVKAIILLFPISEAYERKRIEEDRTIKQEGQSTIDPTIFYIAQTIGNACGTIGLIHALANSDVTLTPGSPLAKFMDECRDKTPEERAQILETTPIFADIHADTASSGQTAAPSADSRTELHFTCFVEAPTKTSRETEIPVDTKRLIELDGRRKGPIDRGPCTDLLLDATTFVKTRYMSESSSMNFSMMSLGPP